MITDAQVSRYRESGYVLVSEMFTRAEAAEHRAECNALAERLSAKTNLDATWGSARQLVSTGTPHPLPPLPPTEGDTVVLHCHNVQFYSAAFARLIVDKRLTGAAAACIGSENVQLHHTKMFIKPPERGSPFPMHQDAPYFPHERHTMMAAIIHFDDAPIEKGCLRVVPGSHKLGMLEHNPEGGWHLPIAEYPVEDALPLPAKAGDVLLFNYLTIHGSGVNTSNEARTTLLVQMRDPTDKPTVKTHESRGQGMMLRGVDPDPDPRGLE